jgi:hypothetical protein
MPAQYSPRDSVSSVRQEGTTMLEQILPRAIDNTYRGRKAALWLFAAVVFAKTAMSLNSIFNGRYVAGRADGIALDSFTPAGAQAVVSLFAIWGLAHLAVCALCVIVLIRYRAMVPLMLSLLLVEHVARRVILWAMPIARTGTPPGLTVNLMLLALILAGLLLSVRSRSALPARA